MGAQYDKIDELMREIRSFINDDGYKYEYKQKFIKAFCDEYPESIALASVPPKGDGSEPDGASPELLDQIYKNME